MFENEKGRPETATQNNLQGNVTTAGCGMQAVDGFRTAMVAAGLVPPESIVGSLLAWVARYPNFKPIFAGDRQSAERLAGKILLRESIEASCLTLKVLP